VKRRPITPSTKLTVLRRDGAMVQCYKCVYQHRTFTEGEQSIKTWHRIDEVHYDHVLALVDGGKHSDDNLKPICERHHRIKSAQEHINNCRSKRLANPKPSKHPMPKASEEIKEHRRQARREFRRKLKERRAT
jgi:hypothetical protein